MGVSVRPSVGLSVGSSVGLSVGPSVGPSDLAFLASNFDISAVYGRIELCFGYGAPVSAVIYLYLMALSLGLGIPGGP